MSIIALWGGDQTGGPKQTEVLAGIASHLGGGVNVTEELPCDDPDLAWGIVLEVPSHPVPIVLWCERARPLSPDELDDPAARACKWALGLETLLPANESIEAFTELVRLLAVPFPSVPAMLDVSSSRWLSRAALDRMFVDDAVGPPTSILWITHIVVVAGVDECDDDPTWLHTHGLWRFGVPELEMLDVPRRFASSAASVINETAELLLGSTLPDPGHSLEIGDQLHVTLRRWQDVIEKRPDDAMGSLADRTRDDSGEHIGPRAVLCSAEPGAECVWPREIIERIADGQSTVYRTRQATERQSRRARASWPVMAMAFASVPQALRGRGEAGTALFQVKAGFADSATEGQGGREHMWFEVCSIDGDCAHGVLVNDPIHVHNLKRGDKVDIERLVVSDWVAYVGETSFGPIDADELLQAVDRLRESNPS